MGLEGTESAGLKRHIVGDARALREKQRFCRSQSRKFRVEMKLLLPLGSFSRTLTIRSGCG
jgi:hypothetical protein